MDSKILELEDMITTQPLDDSRRIELHRLLAVSEEHKIQHELLEHERAIAAQLDNDEPIEHLVGEYKEFKLKHSTYFWDMRGSLDHLFRPFSLWLVRCVHSREHAVRIAIRNKLGHEPEFENLPVEIVREKNLIDAYDLAESLIDFVRRYRGPFWRGSRTD